MFIRTLCIIDTPFGCNHKPEQSTWDSGFRTISRAYLQYVGARSTPHDYSACCPELAPDTPAYDFARLCFLPLAMSETRQELIRLKISAQSLSRTIVAAIALSLSYFAYARSLIPLYGETAALRYLRVLAVSVIGIATSAPIPVDSLNLIGLASILLTTSPTTSYWVAAYSARQHDPVKGPLITHVVVFSPIIYLLSSVLAKNQVYISLKSPCAWRFSCSSN
jgi:hypothetical protein